MAVTAVFVPTPIAPLGGLVEVTNVEDGIKVVNAALLPVDVPALLFAAMR
ncbi:MAG: hypothetical protein Q7J76_01085 [Candidatus Brocadiaceae bacterium]|nr:hypothetical protein [Candidatus Brocadiaceae bacterium]